MIQTVLFVAQCKDDVGQWMMLWHWTMKEMATRGPVHLGGGGGGGGRGTKDIAKPVYKDHSRDQVIVVSVDRWSLCGGATVLSKWFTDQQIVVSIDRWSFSAPDDVILP